ncbi:SRPBCC family protein [Mucilaginibacter myungsuensis]|uniref:SRPBCC family protein n=1 Tax=Mucilaginibacter myungsuensis TaxID=649104 RepID=A0A929L1N9_9SPHI|nr:SRPBCC family protein [Mucilaginibacter myungsuensis]MBE9663983.1 SRPBCC family protein [Mucilaginibacter myungsuensis]MDN3601162.1 SRPBCC family protein [Mucilaginibacter myungsuensis]
MVVLYILIDIIVLFVLYVLIRAAFTSPVSLITADVQINKPFKVVFDYVKLLSTQGEYNKWVMQDPNVKRIYTGTDGTVGSVVAWEGNSKVGKGEQEITAIDEGKRIDWQLRFEKPMKNTSDAWMELHMLSPESTKVIWAFAGNLTYMMKVMHVAFNLPKLLRKDMQTSLNNLKTILEK